MYKLNIKPHSYLFIMILLYPIFYAIPFVNNNIGYAFSNYFFIMVLLLVIILFPLKKIIDIELNLLAIMYILTIIFFIIVFQSSNFEYIKPVIFLLYIIFLYTYFSSSMNTKTMIDTVPTLMYFLLFLSFLFLIDETRYTSLGRFHGFAGSPTTFTVFLDATFIFYLFTNRSNQSKIIVFLIILYFSIISGTRLNLLFLLIIPFLFFILNNLNSRFFRGFLLSSFIIILNLIYPTYQYFSENSDNNMFAQRYEDGRDASFGLRYKMYLTIIEEIENSTVQELILGKGSAYSRQIIIQEFNSDLLPHNDFVRFLLDFGLLASCLYIIFIFWLAIQNNLSVMLAMLYFLAFYHNMIYSYYLISLLIITSVMYQKTLQVKRLI